MRRHGEQEGRAGAEFLLIALAFAALAAPLAWAGTGSPRTAGAHALAQRVLDSALGRPPAALTAFAIPSARRADGTRADHRVIDAPAVLSPELAAALSGADVDARLYVDPARQLAWVDVLDGDILRHTGDPLRALLAHAARRVPVRTSSS